MAYTAYAAAEQGQGARPIDRLLAAAIRGDHRTVRQCLRQPDVPVDLPLSDWGSTPLQCAVEKGQAEVCRLLLARRADVKVQDAFGDTCLHRAAHHGHDEVARALLEGGAPVDLKNELGQTALHVAAMKGHSKLIELLLLWGAELTLEDTGGHTPYDHANQQNRTDAAALLGEIQRRQESLLPHELQPCAAEVLSSYYNVLHEGRKHCHRLRLVIIGPPGSGKSYLREALLGIPLDDSPPYSKTGFFQDGKVYYLSHKQFSPWIDHSRDSRAATEAITKQYSREVARLLLRQVLRHSVRHVSNSKTAVKDMIQRAVQHIKGPQHHEKNNSLHNTLEGTLPTVVQYKYSRRFRSHSHHRLSHKRRPQASRIDEEEEIDQEAVQKALRVIPKSILRQLGLRWRHVLEDGLDALQDEQRPQLELHITEIGGSSHLWRLVAPLLPHQALYLAAYNLSGSEGRGRDARERSLTIMSTAPPSAQLKPLQKDGSEFGPLLCSQLLTVGSLLPTPYVSHVAKACEEQPLPATIICGTHDDDTYSGYTLSNFTHSLYAGQVLSSMLVEKGSVCKLDCRQRETASNEDDEDRQICFLRRHVEMTGRTAVNQLGGYSRVPLAWFNFEAQLHQLKHDDVRYITMEDAWKRSQAESNLNLRDRIELSSMLSYFHSMGWLCYLPHVSALSSYVVCDLSWLVSRLHALISNDSPASHAAAFSNALRLENSGVLENDLLEHIWEEESQEERAFLSQFLDGLDLLASWRTHRGPVQYLPVAVKSNTDVWKSFEAIQQDFPVPLHLVFPNELMIIGLIDRLIVMALRHWQPKEMLLSNRSALIQVGDGLMLAMQEHTNSIRCAVFKPPASAGRNHKHSPQTANRENASAVSVAGTSSTESPRLSRNSRVEATWQKSGAKPADESPLEAVCAAVKSFLEDALDVLRDRWYPGMSVRLCLAKEDVLSARTAQDGKRERSAGPTEEEQLPEATFVDLLDIVKNQPEDRLHCWL